MCIRDRSHESSRVVDKTIDWLRHEYETIFEDGSGAMKVHRGKVHKNLGMGLDFSHKGKCVVTMYNYMDGIIKTWDEAVVKHEQGFKQVTRQRYDSAAPSNLFIVNEDCEKLPEAMAADYHTTLLQKCSMSQSRQGLTHVPPLHFSLQG